MVLNTIIDLFITFNLTIVMVLFFSSDLLDLVRCLGGELWPIPVVVGHGGIFPLVSLFMMSELKLRTRVECHHRNSVIASRWIPRLLQPLD